MKRILIVAVIMAMLMSGCSVMMSTMEQGATQPTVEEMLAQALQLSNAGNYEEAILLYRFFNIGLHDSGGVLSVQRIAFSKEFIVKGIHHFIK